MQYQIAKNGEPISPVFETWRRATKWACAAAHGSMETIGRSPPVEWFVAKDGIAIWDEREIEEHELLSIL